MEDRQVINDSYYCGRLRPGAIVSVLTGASYVVAEYDQRTGDIRWQRVVNASQKEGIHNWLREHFPVKLEPGQVLPVKAAKAPKVVVEPVKAPEPVKTPEVKAPAAKAPAAKAPDAKAAKGKPAPVKAAPKTVVVAKPKPVAKTVATKAPPKPAAKVPVKPARKTVPVKPAPAAKTKAAGRK